MDREEQGKRRCGKITGTCAHAIANGNAKAWATLSRKLWGDDGSKFAGPVGGARGYGQDHEAEGAGKFWEKHPEYELENPGYVDYTGPNALFRAWLGVSPDRLVKRRGLERAGESNIFAGLEVKSPTRIDTIKDHLPQPGGVQTRRRWKHWAQCQHGMLVTGLPAWFLVVHFGEHYHEIRIEADMDWRAMYINRLASFIQYHDRGQGTARKLRVSDILDGKKRV